MKDQPNIISVPLSKLFDSPYQPPGRAEKGLEELVASMLAVDEKERPRGQTTAILVRAMDDGSFRLIGGHRRKAALKAIGATHALCDVRKVSDDEERALFLIDNIQRLSITPLEAAISLNHLLADGGDIKAAAKRIGMTPALASKRLLLLQLIPAAQAALEAGHIILGNAEDLATLRDPKCQLGALAEMTQGCDRPGFEPMDRAGGRLEINRYRLVLSTAPFALDDASLRGGACTQCPKRLLAQGLLFDDADAEDRCLDYACFAAKRADHIGSLPPAPEGPAPEVKPRKKAKEADVAADPPPKVLIDWRAKARGEALLQCVKKMTSPKRDLSDAGLWRLFAGMIIRVGYNEKSHCIARRELGTTLEQALDSVGRMKSAKEAASLCVEMLAELGEFGHPEDAPLDALARFCGVDIDKVQEKLEKEPAQ